MSKEIKKFPPTHYFLNTKANREAVVREFPDTEMFKESGGYEKITEARLAQYEATADALGTHSIDSGRINRCSAAWFAAQGLTEYKFEHEKPEKPALKEGEYIFVPKGKLLAAKEAFRDLAKWGGGTSSCDIIIFRGGKKAVFPGGLSWEGMPNNYIQDFALTEVEWEHSPRGHGSHSAYQIGYVDHAARAIWDGAKWIPERDYRNGEITITPFATSFGNALNACTNHQYTNTVFPSFFTLPKDNEMALSTQEMNDLAMRVAAQLRNNGTEKVAQRGVIAKARGLAWTGTKRSLMWVFKPAAPWLQHAAFIASALAIGYGGYKSYNWVGDNVSLPTITWEQPQDASPSDAGN